MRSFLAVFLFLSVLASGTFYLRPQYISNVVSLVDSDFNRRLYQREVRFSGLKLLKSEKVEKLLPVHFNNFWWRFNLSSITRELSSHPLVQSVSVAPCHFYSLSCFIVAVEERKSGMLAVLANDVGLIGADGGFMVTVAKSADSPRVSRLQQKMEIPIVYGLGVGGASPLMVRSRAIYVMRCKGQLAKAIGKVDEIRISDAGELLVKFKKFPFVVMFNSSFEDPKQLDLEISRFKKLMIDIRGKELAVAKIDMAYEQSAVVTLTEEARSAQAKVLKNARPGE